MQIGGGSQVQQRGAIRTIPALGDEAPFYDGVEGATLLWTKTDTHGVGAISRDTTVVYYGNASLKVTTAAAATDETKAYRDCGLGSSEQSSILRFSCFFTPNTITNGDYVEFQHNLRDGTVSKVVFIRLLATAANTAKLQYYNAAGGYTDVATGLGAQSGLWHYIQFDVDMVNSKLLNIVFGNTKYTLNAALTTSAAVGSTFSTLRCDVFTVEAAAKSSYFDEILLRWV